MAISLFSKKKGGSEISLTPLQRGEKHKLNVTDGAEAVKIKPGRVNKMAGHKEQIRPDFIGGGADIETLWGG